MKQLIRLITIFVLMAVIMPVAGASASVTASGTPYFTVISVIPNSYVTIQTYNFPQNKDFVVLMGAPSSLGINGTHVAGFNTGVTTSGSYRFEIAGSVRGLPQIAIRLESADAGIYLSRIFLNQVNGTTLYPTPIIYPAQPTSEYITINSVSVDSSVTLTVYHLPSGQTFHARMGEFGTSAINGTIVATFDSGSGGTRTMTLAIPDHLKGHQKIDVRIESTSTSTAASTWFYNNTSSTSNPVTPPAAIPTFSITSVVRDSTVTIQTANWPANDNFDVLINDYGTLGIGGVHVATVSSGSGGSMSFTFNIPDSMKGKSRLAIRTQSPTSGFFSYNWFWN